MASNTGNTTSSVNNSSNCTGKWSGNIKVVVLLVLVVFIVLEFFILTTINPDLGKVQAGSKRQLSSVGYHSN